MSAPTDGVPGDAGKIVAVTDDPAAIAAWLARTEALHRQLRPDIPAPYADHLRRMFEEGAEMTVLAEAYTVRALAVYRCHLTTFHGRRFYVDDLVTDEAERARGYGARLLAWCEARARERSCGAFDLESGMQRPRTHRFYFRQGLSIFSFGFTKQLR